jgi:hypothetical protein
MKKILVICALAISIFSCKKEELCNSGCRMEFKNSSGAWVNSGYPDNESCAWYNALMNSDTPTDVAGNPINKSDIRHVCP